MDAQRLDHAAVFPLEKAPHGGRKDEDTGSCMPEDEQLHIPAERWAIPAMVFAVHRPPVVLRCAVFYRGARLAGASLTGVDWSGNVGHTKRHYCSRSPS